MLHRLHACQYCTCMHIQSDFDQHNITQCCMNGEADNSRFVSMPVCMYLAFKELKCPNYQGVIFVQGFELSGK